MLCLFVSGGNLYRSPNNPPSPPASQPPHNHLLPHAPRPLPRVRIRNQSINDDAPCLVYVYRGKHQLKGQVQLNQSLPARWMFIRNIVAAHLFGSLIYVSDMIFVPYPAAGPTFHTYPYALRMTTRPSLRLLGIQSPSNWSICCWPFPVSRSTP